MSVDQDGNRYKGTYLMEEQPLSVQTGLAQMYGTDEAIFLQQLHWWWSNPFAYSVEEGEVPVMLKRARYEGLNFVRLEIKQVLHKKKGRLRFISEPTFKRIVTKLRNAGVLRTETLQESEGDRTNWYAIDYAALEAAEAKFKADLDAPDPSDQNDTTHRISGKVEFIGPKVIRPSDQNDTTISSKVIQSYKDKRTDRTEIEQNNTPVVVADASLVAEMRQIGVSKSVAESIAREHSPEECRAQIKWLPERRADDPPAMLVKAIKEQWAAPQYCNGSAAPQSDAPQIDASKLDAAVAREETRHYESLTPEEKRAVDRDVDLGEDFSAVMQRRYMIRTSVLQAMRAIKE